MDFMAGLQIQPPLRISGPSRAENNRPESNEPVTRKKNRHVPTSPTHENRTFTPAGFGNWFRDQCDAAGITDLSAHGLRKAGATRLAEHGATDHEIMAWGGWKTLREVQRYTAAANRKRMALRAADRLKGGTELSNLGIRFDNKSEKS
jgi:integrase